MEEKNVQLKKFENMLATIERIREMQSKAGGSVFIELIGTPRSGKTVMQNTLTKLLKDNGVSTVIRKSPTTYCPLKPEHYMYNLWITAEILKKVAIDLNRENPEIVIYDSGMLARIPWLRYDIARGAISRTDYDILLSNYDISLYRKYKPISQVFMTSPEKAESRKKNGKDRISRFFIEDYNMMLEDSFYEIKQRSRSFSIAETDRYGDDLKGLAVDILPDLLTRVEKEFNRLCCYKDFYE